METQPIDTNQQRQGRIILILMTIFFVVPIIVVAAMYKFNWKPAGHSHGDLLTPPKLLVNTKLLRTSDGGAGSAFWKERWNMVYVTNACEQACMEKLHLMRQLHVSLYKDMIRSQRVLITADIDVTEAKAKYPDIVIINQPQGSIMSLLAQFNSNGEDAASANRLYLVDPLGHIVMSYKPNTAGADIRQDLVRLMKYSWAG